MNNASAIDNHMIVNYTLSDGIKRKLNICIDGLGLKDENDKLTEKGKYLKNGFFSQETKVPDVWRYNIIINGRDLSIVPHAIQLPTFSKYYDKRIEKSCDSIILLLESPHRSEYSSDNNILEPKAPAQGQSGSIIEKDLELHIKYAIAKSILPDGKYPLIIVNPIQWQTSLGFFYKESLNKAIRNRTWKVLWDKKVVRSDFINRVEAYRPVLVINACTGKNDGSVYRPQNTLHNILMCYLCKNMKGCTILSIYHPARASNFKKTENHRFVTNSSKP